MFYLTYRPQTIDELDNSDAKIILRQILNSQNLPHALLFIGQKGTGKTSAARIFSKSINCLNNKFGKKSDSVEPCNECTNCTSIQTSSSVDIVEMDAASNRGIDEIKRLIQETSFTPMNSTYRVFIIDEAHMITTEGFNALLKTLEEPPSSAVFILATTNPEKLPKTIISRCMTVNFSSAKKTDIVAMLERIAKKENISAEKNLFELIATHSERSFRDAAKLFEELIIHKKLTVEEGRLFLGILQKENLIALMEKGTLKEMLEWIEEFSQKGGNFRHLIEELLARLHMMLLAKNGIAADEEIASDLSIQDISALMKLFNEAYNNLKFSPIESIPLEIAVVEFYNKKRTKL